ncbi:hypothetical protein, partial [Corynebacterium cystitidis]|uniref:hypothetical protein n=1 Tax=Corynebacterium cystitidis TaxID=35757 RepID=UPI001C433428
ISHQPRNTPTTFNYQPSRLPNTPLSKTQADSKLLDYEQFEEPQPKAPHHEKMSSYTDALPISHQKSA